MLLAGQRSVVPGLVMLKGGDYSERPFRGGGVACNRSVFKSREESKAQPFRLSPWASRGTEPLPAGTALRLELRARRALAGCAHDCGCWRGRSRRAGAREAAETRAEPGAGGSYSYTAAAERGKPGPSRRVGGRCVEGAKKMGQRKERRAPGQGRSEEGGEAVAAFNKWDRSEAAGRAEGEGGQLRKKHLRCNVRC